LKKPRVLLADDSEQILRAVVRLLDGQFDVAGSVLNGEQAIEATLRLKPEVLVLDVVMPVMGGFEAARCLKKIGAPAKIVFLTSLEDPALVEMAMEAGGSGFVFKSQVVTDLPLAIQAALAGRTFISTETDPRERHP
jgi:two-component system NarL family response regulator/two-component system response regulator DesR